MPVTFDPFTPSGVEDAATFPPVFVLLQEKWLRVTMTITVGILPLTLLVHLHHGVQAWVSMLDQYDSTVFERKKRTANERPPPSC